MKNSERKDMRNEGCKMKRKELWGTLLVLVLLAVVAAWLTFRLMKDPVPEGMPTPPQPP